MIYVTFTLNRCCALSFLSSINNIWKIWHYQLLHPFHQLYVICYLKTHLSLWEYLHIYWKQHDKAGLSVMLNGVRQGKVQYRMVGSKIGAGYKDKHRTRLWKAVMKRLYRKRQTTPRVILRRDKLVFFVLHSWKISFSCSSSNPYYLTKWLTHSPLTACDFKIFNLLVIKWNSLWFDCTIISCLC